eukprot:CAMPEP_0115403924 /NCGR_PEP_ID=MMETSP0271-20121206/17149_1 /TAXON_ID=71861 /ORGANISM="Scrippsiella trochoidea, Strain CCMP3099" /LENGTH=471 /DNA_ID=CAMNT_0002827875 /DNA_START=50 /DNA_END=1465 /DNA_ORIENTATION=+
MENTSREHRCVVVVDGEQYDITDFLHKHPGGSRLLLFSHGRDATIAVNTAHKDPQKSVYPVLKKYKIESTKKNEEALKDKLGIPSFLLPSQYNASTDTPEYNFDQKDDSLLLNKVRKRILVKDVQQKIKQLDKAFDGVVIALIVAYIGLLYCWLRCHAPSLLAVPVFALLRTCLAAGGHYYIHRGGSTLPHALFDINYVGTCFTGLDGHVLLHHVFTQKDADVKRGFFGGMMGVPRLFRIFAHTLHKLGHMTTGLLIRGFAFEIDPDNRENQGVGVKLRAMGLSSCNWGFWLMQAWLRVELVLAIHCGLFWPWLAQFFVSLWVNTLLVVSSHDFMEVIEPESKDWARFQLLNAHDMSISGNPWVDGFLSAGLAPHRAHHIFPYQRSAWANHYSEQFIAAAAKEAGLPWLPPKNLFTEILPEIVCRQLLAPACDPVTRQQSYPNFASEHLAPSAWLSTLSYIATGLSGIGSV